MNINELYELISNEFDSDEINGEFILHENVIIWSFNLTENSEIIEFLDDNDDDEVFSFETSSTEELLLEAYQEDHDKLEEFLYDNGQTNWTISDNEIVDDVIIFKISK